MVETACTTSAFMLPVAGRPGAGKTFATEAIVAAHVDSGVPIIGCAVSASAAAELENAAGFARSTGMPATTVARLLLDLDESGLAPGSVIVVDEASMLGTRALARLALHAQRAEGAVMLVGDPDQHGAVDVGGVFVRLCSAAGPGLTRLVENNRQSDPDDRLAIDDYREGRVGDSLSRYDDAGRVVRSATAGESFDAMVADWYTQRVAEGRADPMIAGPNSTRRALNERARALLKANGDLEGASLVVAGREFMVGDDVVARRNDRTLRGSHSGFVRNGSPGRVTQLHLDAREVTVEFDREGAIRLPQRYLASGHLDHGYARTTYGVQGATHDVGRYHPTDMSGFEEGYVAITRARRDDTRLRRRRHHRDRERFRPRSSRAEPPRARRDHYRARPANRVEPPSPTSLPASSKSPHSLYERTSRSSREPAATSTAFSPGLQRTPRRPSTR